MDVLPLPISAMPDPSLLRLHRAWHPGPVHVLGEADVGDTGCLLPNQVHMGVEEDGVDGLADRL